MDIDGLASLEHQLEKKRREVGAAIKAERTRRELSLRDVARDVQLAPSTVLEVEEGHTGSTSTVKRVVQYLRGGQQNSRSRARPTV